MTTRRWEHFSHGSDIGLRGFGATPGEAFEMIALALTGVVTESELVRPSEDVQVECHAVDLEFLVYEWLNSIIFEMDHRKMLFSQFVIRELSDNKLKAVIRGETVDRERHHPAVGVKGATMTELKVFHHDSEWTAQCVVDV